MGDVDYQVDRGDDCAEAEQAATSVKGRAAAAESMSAGCCLSPRSPPDRVSASFNLTRRENARAVGTCR